MFTIIHAGQHNIIHALQHNVIHADQHNVIRTVQHNVTMPYVFTCVISHDYKLYYTYFFLTMALWKLKSRKNVYCCFMRFLFEFVAIETTEMFRTT